MADLGQGAQMTFAAEPFQAAGLAPLHNRITVARLRGAVKPMDSVPAGRTVKEAPRVRFELTT